MSSADLRLEVEASIREAFSETTLGEGVSIRQAEAIDQHPWDEPDQEFHSLKDSEVVSDWSQVPFSELERDCVAHLDAAGLRYYLPALMLALLDHYDAYSTRVIGTLSALDGSDPYNRERYSLLNESQRMAIGRFLESLPRLVALDSEDLAVANRSYRDYWKQQGEENRSDV